MNLAVSYNNLFSAKPGNTIEMEFYHLQAERCLQSISSFVTESRPSFKTTTRRSDTTMKYIVKAVLFIVFSVFAILPLDGAAADNTIQNAQQDIARFEQQAAGLSASRTSNIRRILKLLDLSYGRLESFANHADPAWQEVNQRFLSLKNQLETLLSSPGSGQLSNSSSKKISASKGLSRQTGNSTPSLVSGQRVRVKKMARDIASVTESLSTTGPSTLQSGEKIKAYQKRMKQFAEALARYPQIDDPDVKTARMHYAQLGKKLSDEFKRAKKQLAQLGNVQERLKTIATNSRKYAPPQILSPPFSRDEAKAWVQNASNARTVAEHNIKELTRIAKLAYLPDSPGPRQPGPPYDGNDVRQLLSNAENSLKLIENSYKSMSSGLKNRMSRIEQDVLSRYQENPDSDKRWMFISEGRQEEIFDLYDKGIGIAQSSVFLEQALGRTPEQALEILEKIKKAKKDFIRKRDLALETSKMPRPKSEDKKLLAIAKTIIEKEKYGFGRHGRIVLTTKGIVDRERKESEIKIDKADISLGGDLKMSGTETTWTYKWKEFKFAVPLQETENEKWYIWWITAKNFSSGGIRTPLNQWISGKAIKGNRILEKNL